MAIAEMFPYSDQHNLNLDWIIMKIKEFSGNQISGIEVTQIDTDTIKFVLTYTDGSTQELEDVTLPAGPQGPQGPTGATGAAATVSIGTTTTLDAGDDATVTNTGTSGAAVFNFGIPKGAKGDTGPAGGITDINSYTGAVTTGDGITFDTSTGELSSYDFNLSNTGSINMNTLTLPTNVSAASGSINYALNSDGSIGKIYGNVSVTLSSVGSTTWTTIATGITVASPATAYSINVGALSRKATGEAGFSAYISINTSGAVSVAFSQSSAQSGTYWIEYSPCIYFFKDFGDNNRMMRQLGDIIENPIQEER